MYLHLELIASVGVEYCERLAPCVHSSRALGSNHFNLINDRKVNFSFAVYVQGKSERFLESRAFVWSATDQQHGISIGAVR